MKQNSVSQSFRTAWQEVLKGLWKHGLTRIQRKEAQTTPQQNTKKAQRRCKKDSGEVHRRYTGSLKKIQRRTKEAHARIKGGSREIQKRLERKVKEAQRKLPWSSKERLKRRPKEEWKEIQTRLKGGPKGPTEITKKSIRRKRAGLWTRRWDAENNWRKIRSGVGQVPGREIEFPTLVPKSQPSNCKFIMLSTTAKKQILAVQIHTAIPLVFYMYDGTSTPKTNGSLS